MRIGLTYNLRDEYLAMGFGEVETAEFDDEGTVEALERTLQGLGHTTERVGDVRRLTKKLVEGRTWDLVFNIAEGLSGFGREAQVPALLDAFNIPYTFSDPLVLSLTLHKGMAKHIVRDLGVPTPDFVVVDADPDGLPANLSFPLFAKPVAEGSSKGVAESNVINDHRGFRRICGELLAAYEQPVLVEAFLSGREITVGIVGTGNRARTLGAMEIQFLGQANGIYSYDKKVNYKDQVRYCHVHDATARQVTDLALQAWRGLKCKDAGRIDFRCDANDVPYFLEINPLPGLNPEHSDLAILCGLRDIPYERLIRTIIESALQRTKHVIDN